MKRGTIVIISGPSGSGKSTLTKNLLKDNDLRWSVSATTRNPRPGETPGKDYIFLSKEEFASEIAKGHFAEYVELFDNFYGTPKKPLDDALAKGDIIILEIDVEGAKKILKQYPDAVTIFIKPPTVESLKERLKKRSTEDVHSFNKRIQQAQAELQAESTYNYVIVNDEVDKASKTLESIIRTLKQKGV